MKFNKVAVFCGSNSGDIPAFAQAAHAFGALLARRGLTLVYGGGNVGLMGELADGALQAGGHVIGVIPRALMERELAHHGVKEMHVVESMHQRKALITDLVEAYVALPGGFGTFDEFFEVVTWAQLGIHSRPCGLLNTAGFYDPFMALVDHVTERKFVRAEHAAMIMTRENGSELLDAMESWTPAFRAKWIERGER